MKIFPRRSKRNLRKCNTLGLAILIVVFLLIPACGIKKSPALRAEKDFQKVWCKEKGGVVEYVLKDRTRVDCLTGSYAVEVDFAPKWAESIGQSLYYASMTGRKPGVLLIMKSEGDKRHLNRLNTVAKETGIKVWTISPKDLR